MRSIKKFKMIPTTCNILLEVLQKRDKKPELEPDEQHRVLVQVLVNIFEHNPCVLITSSHLPRFKPLTHLLDSNSRSVQKTSTRLLSYPLLEEPYQKDSRIKQVILITIWQKRAIKGLVCIALM